MKAKILIVDDQPDIVTVLRDRLEALGYDTVEASDGLRALEMLERETPAVMLLDLEMPRLSGLEVLKRLAQNRQAGANGQEVAPTHRLVGNERVGNEKGDYTVADRLQKGKVEMADGGTIFLDEIGDMPPGLQAKLLRILQDHEFNRVGGARLVRVNFRIMAATNKDLQQAVKAGSLREGLYFRLTWCTLSL